MVIFFQLSFLEQVKQRFTTTSRAITSIKQNSKVEKTKKNPFLRKINSKHSKKINQNSQKFQTKQFANFEEVKKNWNRPKFKLKNLFSSNSHNLTMSWQSYVDDQLLNTKMVTHAVICGHDGNIWASSNNFSVSFV